MSQRCSDWLIIPRWFLKDNSDGLPFLFGLSSLLMLSLGSGCGDPEGAPPTISMQVPSPAAVSATPADSTESPDPSTPTDGPTPPPGSSEAPEPSPTEVPSWPSEGPSPTASPTGPTPSPTAVPTVPPTPTSAPTPTLTPDGDLDGFPPALDCNDGDAQTFPGAAELCDGQDNDCDGSVTGEEDADFDSVRLCASPPDCNDADALIFPGAVDLCDGIDQDCDGTLDEDGEQTWYADEDQDGWGSSSAVTQACQAPQAYTGSSGDCNDLDPAVYPDAPELCDRQDNNCNGQVDEALDLDLDGYTPCGSPSDCNDQDSSVHPDAAEHCDGIDQNCDGDQDSAWKTPRGLGFTVTQGAPAGSADGTSGHPFPTIQQAINESSSLCPVVWINPGTYPENLLFQGHSAEVVGAYGAENTVVSGGSKESVVRLDKSSKRVQLEGLTLESGKANRGGGIFCAGSRLTLDNVVIDSNSALEFGGGVWSDDCDVTAVDTVFTSNVARASAGTAAGAGAGLYARSGRIELVSVSFIDGSTYQFGGGAAFLDGAEAIIQDSLFEQNTVGTYAFAQGGGIYSAYSHLQVFNSSFLDNTANNQGGGIWMNGCTDSSTGEPCQLEEVWLEGNKTLTGGGAGLGISGLGSGGTGSLTILRCTFTENVANGGGGGLALLQSSPRVINSLFHCNAGTNGGGIYLDNSSAEILHSTLLENNVSQNGGGIYFVDASSSPSGVRIVNNVVYRNLRNGIAHAGATSGWVFLNNDVYLNGVGNQNWVGVADPTGTSGNISVEPGFQVYKADCDLKGDNLEPLNNSPLLDAATEQLISEDIRRKHRPVDGNRDSLAVPDIGAYERQ